MEEQRDIIRTHRQLIRHKRLSHYQHTGLDSELFSLHKRTERVVAALYTVVSTLSDIDPIGHKIKELGIDLLSFLVSVPSPLTDGGKRFTGEYARRLLEIVSLLDVGMLSGLISEMNHRVISGEMDHLINESEGMAKRVESLASEDIDHVLTGGWALREKGELPPLSVGERLRRRVFPRGISSKGHKNVLKKKTSLVVGVSRAMDKDSGLLRETRGNVIKNVLKDGKHLTVKDFVTFMPGVSEKTIQRELISLVQAGVLKKEGERRWSRYFIAIPIVQGEPSLRGAE
jgi:hypothetical protein